MDASRTLRTSGYAADAVSRAYYAMFYAAHAALRAKGVAVAKHSAVIAEFGRHYAKTSELDTSLHRALIDAFDERQEADYDIFVTISDSQAGERIDAAERFVDAVRTLLTQGGHA